MSRLRAVRGAKSGAGVARSARERSTQVRVTAVIRGIDGTLTAYPQRRESTEAYKYTYDVSPTPLFDDVPSPNKGVGACKGNDDVYIDHVVLRDKDANTGAGGWTTAYDGTREERRYYAQNWRADVSAVVTSAGKLVEWVKHSSYGQSIGLAAGDTDSDRDWDATDSSYITGISGYEIRKDPDLDKDADAADVTFANSIKGSYHSMGRGVLSAVGNRKGYGGYENDIYLFKLFHVRHRIFDDVLGRWTKRDPIGRLAGPNYYTYVHNAPTSYLDRFGLCGTKCAAAPTPPSHTFPKGGFPRTREQCCSYIEHIVPPNDDLFGITFCCDGRPVICLYEGLMRDRVGDPDAANIMIECTRRHELEHFNDIDCSSPPFTTPTPFGPMPLIPGIWPGRIPDGSACSECRAWQQTALCLTAALYRCPTPSCVQAILPWIDSATERMLYYCNLCRDPHEAYPRIPIDPISPLGPYPGEPIMPMPIPDPWNPSTDHPFMPRPMGVRARAAG